METKRVERVDDYTGLYHHEPSRPIKFVKDNEGYGWLCDKKADPMRDLRVQGCWRCDEMAFPEGGR
jgi:hypothetical protein